MTETTTGPSDSAELDATIFRPYVIVKPLGKGSYGQVFRAKNADMDFAIKILHEDKASNPAERRTFLNEAERLYRISHDRVISARHVDAEAETPWFVMDFADQGSLDEWVTDQKTSRGVTFTLEQLVGLGTELCACLRALHAYELVHFDLKPNNVLIRTFGADIDNERGRRYRLPAHQRLVLGDLGLARTKASLNVDVGGTPQYVAPEVFTDGGSQRSDLFALGMMLYEFAHPPDWQEPILPYEGRVPSSEARRRHLLADPSNWGPYRPLADVRPDLPPDFDQLIRRALAPEPADRYESALELQQALDGLLRRTSSIRVTRPVDALVRGVSELITSVRDLVDDRPSVSGDVYQTLDTAAERLRRLPQVAVLPHGGVEDPHFSLFLAGEPITARAPAPYGSVVSYIREGDPERAIVETQSGSRSRVRLQRDQGNVLRAELDTADVRQLILELDHPVLSDLELVDIPPSADRRQVSQVVSLADFVVVLIEDRDGAATAISDLRDAARRSPAGPCGLIAVDGASGGFGRGRDEGTRAIEDLGFHQVLPHANAGLALRVYFQQMLEGATGKYIAGSAALALCETACDRTGQWEIARAFVDGRDRLEAEYPELRDVRHLREDIRGETTLPPRFARNLRQALSQPTAAGKLDLAADQADVDTVRQRAEERLFAWMTALADGTVPAESADAARVVVATLRRLQDAETV